MKGDGAPPRLVLRSRSPPHRDMATVEPVPAHVAGTFDIGMFECNKHKACADGNACVCCIAHIGPTCCFYTDLEAKAGVVNECGPDNTFWMLCCATPLRMGGSAFPPLRVAGFCCEGQALLATRQAVLEKYKIQEDPCETTIYAFCCGTCAMAQQSNQLMTHEGFVMDGPQKVKKAEPPKLTEMPRA